MIAEQIRVTKKFTFDMAHALYGHDGSCKNIHGHTYHLSITLIGKAKQEKGHPKDGMVIDFGDLKKLVQQNIISNFDHTLVLNSNAPYNGIELLQEHYPKIMLVPFQPSCENLIIEIKNRLLTLFASQNFQLYSIRLDETPSSYAEWFAADN